jgi:RNA polymerase subunit RPABC4/transcription elongation factor Spt4
MTEKTILDLPTFQFKACKKCGHISGAMPEESLDKCPNCGASFCVEKKGFE